MSLRQRTHIEAIAAHRRAIEELYLIVAALEERVIRLSDEVVMLRAGKKTAK